MATCTNCTQEHLEESSLKKLRNVEEKHCTLTGKYNIFILLHKKEKSLLFCELVKIVFQHVAEGC